MRDTSSSLKFKNYNERKVLQHGYTKNLFSPKIIINDDNITSGNPRKVYSLLEISVDKINMKKTHDRRDKK
jgi:hypothetical protein